MSVRQSVLTEFLDIAPLGVCWTDQGTQDIKLDANFSGLKLLSDVIN